MNLLAHLWLAERSQTSAAGQILGDVVKGRLDAPVFDALVDRGIRLHRRIDSRCDAHPAHQQMRDRFVPPLRRYAGIIVDIGFDYALARGWAGFHAAPLAVFANRLEQQVIDEWPADAPFTARRMRGLAATLVGYQQPAGIERALTSVAHRLRRDNPLGSALTALIAETAGFEARLPGLLSMLESSMHEPLP